jgi:hypothetical protein
MCSQHQQVGMGTCAIWPPQEDRCMNKWSAQANAPTNSPNGTCAWSQVVVVDGMEKCARRPHQENRCIKWWTLK